MPGLAELLEQLVASPWLYAVVFAVVAVDSFLPLVPSETVVIGAGVHVAATPAADSALVITAAAAGAFVGDLVAYRIGRGTGHWARRSGRRSAVAPRLDWARNALAARGGVILLAARFLPGGRTATTLVCGGIGYPPARFRRFVAAAGLLWAVYTTLLGYLGGRMFADRPLLAVLTGLGVAATVGVVLEVARRLLRRRGDRAAGSPDERQDTGREHTRRHERAPAVAGPSTETTGPAAERKTGR